MSILRIVFENKPLVPNCNIIKALTYTGYTLFVIEGPDVPVLAGDSHIDQWLYCSSVAGEKSTLTKLPLSSS